MNTQARQKLLDQLSELVSAQTHAEAFRRRLIHQLYVEGDCSLSEIADACGLTRSGVRYLLTPDPRRGEGHE